MNMKMLKLPRLKQSDCLIGPLGYSQMDQGVLTSCSACQVDCCVQQVLF